MDLFTHLTITYMYSSKLRVPMFVRCYGVNDIRLGGLTFRVNEA
jgi:hypothetical protein